MWILQLRRFFGNGQTVALSVIPHLWAMPLGVYGHMWTQIWAASYSVGRVPLFGWHRTNRNLRSINKSPGKSWRKVPDFLTSPWLRSCGSPLRKRLRMAGSAPQAMLASLRLPVVQAPGPNFGDQKMGRSNGWTWLNPEIGEAWEIMGVMGIYTVYIRYITIFRWHARYLNIQETGRMIPIDTRRGAVRSCTWRAAIPLSRAWGRREWAPQLSGWKWQQFSGRVLKQWDFEVSLFGQSHSSPWYHTNVHCRNRKWFKNMVTHQVDTE